MTTPAEGAAARGSVNWGGGRVRVCQNASLNKGPRHARACLTRCKRFLGSLEKICPGPRKTFRRRRLFNRAPRSQGRSAGRREETGAREVKRSSAVRGRRKNVVPSARLRFRGNRYRPLSSTISSPLCEPSTWETPRVCFRF